VFALICVFLLYVLFVLTVFRTVYLVLVIAVKVDISYSIHPVPLYTFFI